MFYIGAGIFIYTERQWSWIDFVDRSLELSNGCFCRGESSSIRCQPTETDQGRGRLLLGHTAGCALEVVVQATASLRVTFLSVAVIAARSQGLHPVSEALQAAPKHVLADPRRFPPIYLVRGAWLVVVGGGA